MKKMVKRKEVVFWIIVIALIATLVYIGVEKIQERELSKLQGVYLQGITDTVTTLYAQTNNCQITTITLGNETRQVIDVSCLQQAKE